MITILVRTLIIYCVLSITVRLMGKRQIGQLEVSDLVTTLLISEIASLPITNLDIPVSYAVIPILTLLFLEVVSSLILIRFPGLKALVSARPTVLILHGQLQQKALRDMRVSLDELMSAVRQEGLQSLFQVDCAILEKNGRLSVMPKSAELPPTAGQLGKSFPQEPLMHVVYNNRKFDKTGLKLIGKDESWVKKQLLRRGVSLNSLFCVTADENGKLYWILEEKP